MLKIISFIFWAILISVGLIFLLDSNGTVIINWLGYEIRTNIVSAFLLMTLASILIFILAAFLTKIISVKNKIFNLFRKSKVV